MTTSWESRLCKSRLYCVGARHLVVALMIASQPVRAQVNIGFQPAFHQALRWSYSSGARETYRMKIPIGRAGNRVRVTFKAGDEALQLFAATIALAGTGGALASEPIALTFGGSRVFSASPRQRFTSDPVAFPATLGVELYVSFYVQGSLGISTIYACPDSYVWPGDRTDERFPPPGSPWLKSYGVDTIEVEGASSRAVVALGDSITEGYISGDVGPYNGHSDDVRNAWPAVAQENLRIPVVNAGVSGQGVDDAIRGLPAEILPMQGITDCAILIGTNDLHGMPAEQIETRIGDLLNRLRPFCRLWLGTLLPKELSNPNQFALESARRIQVNDWIRRRAEVAGVIDFEAAVAVSGDPNRFRVGLGEDGIHPTVAGQRIMGQEAARVLSPPMLIGLSPDSGPSAGGTTLALRGENFKPGVTVVVGGVPANGINVSSPTALTFTSPPHAQGPVDISLANPDGLSAQLRGAFSYVGPTPEAPPGQPSDPIAPKRSGCSVGGEGSDLGLFILIGFLMAASGLGRGRKEIQPDAWRNVSLR